MDRLRGARRLVGRGPGDGVLVGGSLSAPLRAPHRLIRDLLMSATAVRGKITTKNILIYIYIFFFNCTLFQGRAAPPAIIVLATLRLNCS